LGLPRSVSGASSSPPLQREIQKMMEHARPEPSQVKPRRGGHRALRATVPALGGASATLVPVRTYKALHVRGGDLPAKVTRRVSRTSGASPRDTGLARDTDRGEGGLLLERWFQRTAAWTRSARCLYRRRMPIDFDLRRPEILADPYPALGELRERDPVHWSDGLRVWLLTRYDHVRDTLRDPRLSADRMRPFFEHLPAGERARLR